MSSYRKVGGTVSEQVVLTWARPARGKLDHKVERAGAAKALCGAAVGGNALWLLRPQAPCQKCAEAVRSQALAEYVEYLLEEMRRPMALDVGSPWGRVRHEQFDGAMPMLPEAVELADGGEGWIFRDWHPSEVGLRKTRLLVRDTDNEGEVAAVNIRLLRPAEAHGRIRPALPYPTLVSSWWPKDGKVDVTAVGLAGPGRWVNIDARRAGSSRLDDYWSAQIQVALGCGMFLRSRWTVYLADGGLGVTFPTDEVGAQEVFRLRDIPEGKARRAALRAWVTEHWRVNPQRPDEEVLVREHLRGAQAFDWSGLHCRITPSDDDFAREYQAKVAREQARQDGTDRRPAQEDR